MFCLMASSVEYPLVRHLCHHLMYHMISPPLQSSLNGNASARHRRLESCLSLPAVSEVCGEILFRLLILISVWILILAVESEGTSHCKVCVRSVATRFAMDL